MSAIKLSNWRMIGRRNWMPRTPATKTSMLHSWRKAAMIRMLSPHSVEVEPKMSRQLAQTLLSVLGWISLFLMLCAVLAGCGNQVRTEIKTEYLRPSEALLAPTPLAEPNDVDEAAFNWELRDLAKRCTVALQMCNHDKRLIAREPVPEAEGGEPDPAPPSKPNWFQRFFLRQE